VPGVVPPRYVRVGSFRRRYRVSANCRFFVFSDNWRLWYAQQPRIDCGTLCSEKTWVGGWWKELGFSAERRRRASSQSKERGESRTRRIGVERCCACLQPPPAFGSRSRQTTCIARISKRLMLVSAGPSVCSPSCRMAGRRPSLRFIKAD